MQQLQEREIIAHNDIRVLTTAQLAESLNTKSSIINRNFQRNKKNFLQGVHYFALTGEELKRFKASRQNDVTLKYVSVLYLWTEQGAWMHARHLKTEKARTAMNALIANYFSTSKQFQRQEHLPIPYERFIEIERKVEWLEQQLREVTLHSGEQIRVRKAVAARVYELSEKPGSKSKQLLFRELYAALKERYQVGSYRDIKQYQLQDALRFIETWEGRL
ncbi:ORF6N domain-containing protein [Ureibacillus sp. FSL K6-2830]|uniref:ORF6N domain-containing protein n=1 Tax=Ureibacillus sp. FSL K6-2830 TaxID=2954610 RepID=UPI0030F60EE9